MYNFVMQPTGFLVMGVSASGKSTLGRVPGQKLGWDFFDADDFQSQFDVLEEPRDVLALDVSMSLKEMLDTINARYFMRRGH